MYLVVSIVINACLLGVYIRMSMTIFATNKKSHIFSLQIPSLCTQIQIVSLRRNTKVTYRSEKYIVVGRPRKTLKPLKA